MIGVICFVSYIIIGILVFALLSKAVNADNDDESMMASFFWALFWPISIWIILYYCIEMYNEDRKTIIGKIKRNKKVFDIAISLLEELPLESFDVIKKDELKIHDDQAKNKVLLSLIELSDGYRLSYVGIDFVFPKTIFLQRYIKLFKKRLAEAREMIATDGQDAEEVANKIRERILKY